MKSIYIWGAGKNAENTFHAINKEIYDVLGIIDSDKTKHGKVWKDNILIYPPEILTSTRFDLIVISTVAYLDIMKNCLAMSISQQQIISYFDEDYFGDVFIDIKTRRTTLLELKLLKSEIKLKNIPYECSMEDIKIPIVLSAQELAERILSDRLSLCRFGDGEFEMIRNNSRPWFQEKNSSLGKMLLKVLHSDQPGIAIAIANNFSALDCYTDEAAYAIRQYMVEARPSIMGLLQENRTYYDAYISRPYIMHKDITNAQALFPLLKKIWKNRNILIIEGEYSRMGIHNDLFYGASSIKRILCPPKNAFCRYDEILDCATNYSDANTLVLISLGPTATVLAYDLSIRGFQALDIGQIDNEYDWYLAGAKTRTPLSGKCTAEIPGFHVPQKTDCQEYEKQIVKNLND